MADHFQIVEFHTSILLTTSRHFFVPSSIVRLISFEKVVARSPLFLTFMFPKQNLLIMKELKLILVVLLFFFHPEFTNGQTKVKDTITRKATIGYDKKGNLV